MGSWFRPKSRIPPPFQYATLMLWVRAADTGQPLADAPIDLFEPDFPAPEDGRTNADGYFAAQMLVGRTHTVEVHADGFESVIREIYMGESHSETFELPRLAPLYSKRMGAVRADRRAFTDDGGLWHPLGASMLWALWGWKFDRARAQTNLTFLRDNGIDAVRILCEVGGTSWADRAVDPAWSDYREQLGGLVDWAYDTLGLRTIATAYGGGTGADPLALARTVADVLRPRAAKVLYVEAVNEAFDNLDVPTAQAMAVVLAGSGLLTAVSSAEGGNLDGTKVLASGTPATLSTGHFDRSDGDWLHGVSWRECRQTYDWKDWTLPGSHNEPKGPRSSVAMTSDPMALAMMRVNGILHGVGAFVFHTGAGVRGGGQWDVNPPPDAVRFFHPREANFSEVPHFAEIASGLRHAAALLPAGVENWAKTSQSGATARRGPQPLLADAIWSDGSDHGVNRNYGAVDGAQWVQVPYAIQRYVDLTPERNVRFDVWHPLTGELQASVTLNTGQAYRLPGPDEGGLAAYMLTGMFV